MGKSTYSIIPGEETNQLTLILQSMRIPSLQCKGAKFNLTCGVSFWPPLPSGWTAVTTSVTGRPLKKPIITPTTCLRSVFHKGALPISPAPNQPPYQSMCITRWQQTFRRSNMTTMWNLLRPSRDETSVTVDLVLLRSSCLILCCPFKETSIHAAIHPAHACRDIVVGTMTMQITLNSRKWSSKMNMLNSRGGPLGGPRPILY